MGRLGKIVNTALLVFVVVASGLLTLASFMSDKLTKAQAVERIMAADEPCRAAYAKVVDLQAATGADPAAVAQASREGEPVCRAAFKALDAIKIFVPSEDGDEERGKRDAIGHCAALEKARADLLAYHGGGVEDAARLRGLDTEIDRAGPLCRRSFARLAG